MKKRLFALSVCVLLLLSYYQCVLHPSYPCTAVYPEASQASSKKILLIPLDGRPPCRNFVLQAGSIAGYEVLSPPSELQDYYSLPADTQKLPAWIKENIARSHAVILSIDQLLYGGLLAAREKEAPPEKQAELFAFLRQLHRDFPNIPIYAFSILPRLTPQDTIDGYYEKRYLMEYSRLVGKQHAGLPVDESELSRLAEKISSESMEKYLSHFQESTSLNRNLASLAKEGTLERLILGQDDGEKYSIPNIEKEKLQNFLQAEEIPESKVFLTHGADEIALALLAEIKTKDMNFHPCVCVKYNDEKTPDRIMPYMAVSTKESAEEKLRMLHAKLVASPKDANITLFISCNNSDEDTLASRRNSLHALQSLLSGNHPIALVDLSKHFQKEETLLPLLIQEDYPLNTLAAYAGWNTTSNSIGTALAQALLFASAKRDICSKQDAINLYAANLTFLQNRILEDSFYLKDVIDLVNTSLIKAGYINTGDLDLEHNYRWANAMLQSAMQERLADYKHTKAFRQPFLVTTPTEKLSLCAQDLQADMSYPWPRTFEIYLQTTLFLGEVQ